MGAELQHKILLSFYKFYHYPSTMPANDTNRIFYYKSHLLDMGLDLNEERETIAGAIESPVCSQISFVRMPL